MLSKRIRFIIKRENKVYLKTLKEKENNKEDDPMATAVLLGLINSFRR